MSLRFLGIGSPYYFTRNHMEVNVVDLIAKLLLH